jgi:hypothetical protein
MLHLVYILSSLALHITDDFTNKNNLFPLEMVTLTLPLYTMQELCLIMDVERWARNVRAKIFCLRGRQLHSPLSFFKGPFSLLAEQNLHRYLTKLLNPFHIFHTRLFFSHTTPRFKVYFVILDTFPCSDLPTVAANHAPEEL